MSTVLAPLIREINLEACTAGADIEAANDAGETPLDVAARF